MGSCESKRSSLSLTQARTWQGPLAPRALPRFDATTNPADSRPEPNEKLCLPSRRCALQRTQSGLPGSWLFVRHAPPPITPESTPGANARCFPGVGRFRHRWQVDHPQVNLTRPNRVQYLRLMSSPFEASTDGCSVVRSIGYLMNEQLQGKLLSAHENSQTYP